MTLTDFLYFKGDINIPMDNINSVDFTNDYITVYEEEILAMVLGRDLYNDFMAGLGEDSVLAKWTALRDGKEYQVTDNGNTMTVKWEGLKNSKRVSLLSYYIYINWTRSNYQQNTAIGVTSADKENARDVSAREKVVHAYSACKKLVGEYHYKSDYEINVLYQKDIEEENLKKLDPSLFNFLYYNRSDYTNWVFRFPDIYGVNMFDI